MPTVGARKAAGPLDELPRLDPERARVVKNRRHRGSERGSSRQLREATLFNRRPMSWESAPLAAVHPLPRSPKPHPRERSLLFLKADRPADYAFRDVVAPKEDRWPARHWLTDQPDIIAKTIQRNRAAAPSR